MTAKGAFSVCRQTKPGDQSSPGRELQIAGLSSGLTGLLLAVEAFVDVSELGVGDMGVDLGGRDVGVTQQPLDASDVGTVHQ